MDGQALFARPPCIPCTNHARILLKAEVAPLMKALKWCSNQRYKDSSVTLLQSCLPENFSAASLLSPPGLKRCPQDPDLKMGALKILKENSCSSVLLHIVSQIWSSMRLVLRKEDSVKPGKREMMHRLIKMPFALLMICHKLAQCAESESLWKANHLLL